MDNQIHFEQTPYHHVYLKDRKTLELTGIKKIESFDSLEFLIETSSLLSVAFSLLFFGKFIGSLRTTGVIE